MTNKSIAIIIDDFSDRIFEYDYDYFNQSPGFRQNLPNVTLYDYGTLSITNSHDYFYNLDGSFDGYGDGARFLDNDYIETLYVANNDSFIIFPLNNSNYDFINDDSDVDFINLTSQQQPLFNLFGADVFEGVQASSIAQDNYGYYLLDNFGFPYLSTVSNNIIRQDSSPTSNVNHGDWVLEAFSSALERPELTEIICIDVDTLNGFGSHYSELFKLENSILDPAYLSTNIENILVDFLQSKGVSFLPDAVNDDIYSVAGLSISIAGVLAQEEIPTLETMEFLQSPIIQASPNVASGSYDWGSNYPDVINVGAWNEATNGELLLSSFDTLSTIDIAADGYILKDGWGSNFGTSFATPRVTAEITNVINDYLYETKINGEILTTIADSSACD